MTELEQTCFTELSRRLVYRQELELRLKGKHGDSAIDKRDADLTLTMTAVMLLYANAATAKA